MPPCISNRSHQARGATNSVTLRKQKKRNLPTPGRNHRDQITTDDTRAHIDPCERNGFPFSNFDSCGRKRENHA